jgi:hypothetical protein
MVDRSMIRGTPRWNSKCERRGQQRGDLKGNHREHTDQMDNWERRWDRAQTSAWSGDEPTVSSPRAAAVGGRV